MGTELSRSCHSVAGRSVLSLCCIGLLTWTTKGTAPAPQPSDHKAITSIRGHPASLPLLLESALLPAPLPVLGVSCQLPGEGKRHRGAGTEILSYAGKAVKETAVLEFSSRYFTGQKDVKLCHLWILSTFCYSAADTEERPAVGLRPSWGRCLSGDRTPAAAQ